MTHRAKPRDPLWETNEALGYFHFKYMELVFHYGLYLLDTTKKSPLDVFNHILEFLANKEQWTEKEFLSLPHVAEGESKEIRSLNVNYDMVKLKPSIYSQQTTTSRNQLMDPIFFA